MRKLATIRRIASIYPIPGADAIECAQVDGWKVVVKKGEFSVGTLAVYFEIDSWIPRDVAPFLCKDEREYNGVIGARLRTVKLRGQVSQGLLLPASPEYTDEGQDITEAMGIQKWEPPISPQLSGIVRGSFPAFLKKTDQERVQNMVHDIAAWREQGLLWEVTEKLDGSSMTVYYRDGDFGVCSRNLDLARDDKNSFWAMALKLGLEDKMRALGRNIALQGELIGPGIQGNKYGLTEHQFHLFDIFDISTFGYLGSTDRHIIAGQLGLIHAPVQSQATKIHCDITGLLEWAEGPSFLPPFPTREGLVFKCLNLPDLSFKVISNKFLLAEK